VIDTSKPDRLVTHLLPVSHLDMVSSLQHMATQNKGVEAAVAGLEPRQIDVRVAPNDVLIAADVHHDHGRTADVLLCEFNAGPLFRSYHFDRPIDPERVTADYKNGLLRITAPLAPGPTP